MSIGLVNVGTSDIVANQKIYASSILARWAIIAANNERLEDKCVILDGVQTVTGAKTFEANITTIAPSSDLHVATRKYVDDSVAALDDARVYYDGTQIATTADPGEFTDLDLPELSANLKAAFDNTRVMVTLLIETNNAYGNYWFRTKGYTSDVGYSESTASIMGHGVTAVSITNNHHGVVSVMSDENGIIQWYNRAGSATANLTLLTYQKIH